MTEATRDSDHTIRGVYLPSKPSHSLWDVSLGSEKKIVTSIQRHECQKPPKVEQQCNHGVLLPSLTHPHIHFDKAFLFSSHGNEGYSDLVPREGDFAEALKITAAAKARFEPGDLYQRGSWLVQESIAAGVTAMRAFVEVDETVGLKCVETAIRLKREFAERCVIQICAFAQDPIFSGLHGETNLSLMTRALEMAEVEVLGTTPYVEDSTENAIKNIRWAVEMSLRLNRHLDFHLDYNIKQEQQPLIWEVVDYLTATGWVSKTSKTIAVGHCTRLTLFSDDQLKELAQRVMDTHLPISFIGLPSSDLYMMGRPEGDDSARSQRPRGTMQVPSLIRLYNLNGALGVNNVGNAFTPYGSVDPLWLACLGVGIYHAGTISDAHLLFECVSTRARKAIGLRYSSLELKEGDPIDFMVVECKPRVSYSNGLPRLKTTLQEMVWDPPPLDGRTTWFSAQ